MATAHQTPPALKEAETAKQAARFLDYFLGEIKSQYGTVVSETFLNALSDEVKNLEAAVKIIASTPNP